MKPGRNWGICAVGLALLASSPAWGQEPAENEAEALETVIVVGTAIKGSPIRAPLAVSAVSRQDMEDRGEPTLTDFFKGLGASHGVVGERSSNFNHNQLNTIATSVGNVNLRGLGASRTLVLINQRRQVYLPARLIGGRFVDVNVIPMSAIERIEVLKEGAAAVYGSDAIGGVVNFMTRRHFKGLELSVAHEAIKDAGATRGALVWGKDFGSTHLMVAVEQERQDALPERRRPYLLAPWRDNAGLRAGWSSFGNPGAYNIRDAAGQTVDTVVDPRCVDFGGVLAAHTCRYRYQSFSNLLEDTRFNRVFAELTGEWGKTTEYHVEALWSEARVADYQVSPSYPFVNLLNQEVLEVAADHPGRQGLCEEYGAAIAGCGGVEPWYFRGRTIGNAGPAATVDQNSQTWRLAGSVEGLYSFAGAEYGIGLGLTVSHAEGNLGDAGTWTERLFLAFRGYGGPDCGVGVIPDHISGGLMRLNPADLSGKSPGAGNCQYFNPFSNALQYSAQPGAPLQGRENPGYRPDLANDAALREWLAGTLDLESESDLVVFDATIGREWIPDVASYAFGYQFRRFDASGSPNLDGSAEEHPCPVRFDTRCPERDRFGPYAFSSVYDSYDVDQTVHRLFGEVAFTWRELLDVQLAADYEKYGEADSFDPKLALLWNLNEALAVRGSLQTTFRTPSVDELNEDKLTTLQWVRQTGAYINIDRVGSPDLKPESALTWTAGLIWSAGGNLEFTADYWQYKLDDVIDSAPYARLADLYEQPGARDAIAQYIVCPQGRASAIATPCPVSDLARITAPLVNWPGVKTSGLDLRLSGRADFAGGELMSSVEATWTREYQIDAIHLSELNLPAAPGQDLELLAARDAAGGVNFGHPLASSIPEWKASWSASWWRNQYGLSSHLNYIAPYEDRSRPTSQPNIGSFLTWDLTAQWELPSYGLRLSVSALNVTDEKAPLANLEQGFDGHTHSAKGRRIRMGAVYLFGK